MRSVDYSALAASAPINKDAALARDGHGFAYSPAKKIVVRQWDGPPAMRSPRPGMPDLVGCRFGRMTVIGLLDEPSGGNGAKWVCRCSCGTYEPRKSKAIQNPNNTTDACQQCRHVLFLKREEHWRRTGKDLPIEVFA